MILKRNSIAVIATSVFAALGTGLPALAEIIVPEGGAGTALRLSDALIPAGRIEGLGNVHGMAAAPGRGILVAGSLATVSRGEVMKPADVSQADHAAHHGSGMKTQNETADEVGLVTLVDIGSGTIQRQIEVPAGVHHVTVDPAERWAVVTHPALDAVSIIDLDTAAVTATVPTGGNPNYAVFDDPTGLFYVSNAADATITGVDPATGTVQTTLETPGGVEHMVIEVAGRRIWGAEADDGQVDEIDLEAGAVSRSFAIRGELHGIALDPASGEVFVAAREQGQIARIDPQAETVTFAKGQAAPYHVEIDGDLLIVSDAQIDQVAAFRLRDLELVATVPTRSTGHQMVVLPD